MNKPFTANYSSSKLYPVPVQELPGNSLDAYWCLCQWKQFLEIIWISTSSCKSPEHSLLWILYPWHAEGNARHLGIFSSKGKWGLQIFGAELHHRLLCWQAPHTTDSQESNSCTTTVSQLHPSGSSHSKRLKHANYLPQIIKPNPETHFPTRNRKFTEKKNHIFLESEIPTQVTSLFASWASAEEPLDFSCIYCFRTLN